MVFSRFLKGTGTPIQFSPQTLQKYAGARKDKDIEALNAIENVQAIRLDVNKQEQIDAAVKSITQAGRGLYGLVNNAGVALLSPLIEMLDTAMAKQAGVNQQWRSQAREVRLRSPGYRLAIPIHKATAVFGAS